MRNDTQFGKTEIGPSNIHRDPKPQPGFSIWIERGVFFTAPTVDPEKFGGHDYGSGTGDCRCGCWMGQSYSSGPVDPFGACPCNPKPAMTPALAAAIEEVAAVSAEQDDSQECQNCHELYLLRDGDTPTKYCDHCAHTLLEAAELEIATLKQRHSKLIEALRKAGVCTYPSTEQPGTMDPKLADALKLIDDIIANCSAAEKHENRYRALLKDLESTYTKP